jgi:hypothetical protein
MVQAPKAGCKSETQSVVLGLAAGASNLLEVDPTPGVKFQKL